METIAPAEATATPKTPRDHFLQLLRRDVLALDDADLDFGIYRILARRRAAIDQFLTVDLPARLDAVVQGEGKRALDALDAAVEEARRKVEAAAEASGYASAFEGDALISHVAETPRGKEYVAKVTERDQLAAQGGFSRDEESDLYHHLFTFFSRYYRDGDFQPQPRRGRRYAVPQTDDATEADPGVPVTPYNGQDVHLHWRSRGMHYAKTAEHFRVYRATDADSGRALRFEVVAAETDRDNAKAAEDRFFVPLPKQAHDEDGTFVLPFEHRALTPAERTRVGKRKKDAQDALLDEATEGIKKMPAGLTKTALARHVARYVKRNQRDYFVHPALGRFLRDELDYYLKAEYLDIAATLDATTLADRLGKLQALRSVAFDLIDLLDGIETYQARLFEKRRFVFASDWLVPLRLVPEALHADVLAEPRQISAWHSEIGLEGDVTADTLRDRPTLVVDTRHFRQANGANPFRDALLATFEDIDGVTDGVLVYGENYGALRTLGPRYREAVKCTYIDPPYNTGGGDFLYKDDFARHSTWLSMMEERLRLGREMMSRDGDIQVSHDNNEYHNLRWLADRLFEPSNFIGNIVWKGSTDNNPTRIATEHEYILSYAKDSTSMEPVWESSVNETKERMLSEFAQIKSTSSSTEETQVRFRKFIKENQDDLVPLTHYNRVDEEGPYTGSRKVHNPGKEGYRYDILHNVTGKPCVQPARGYRFPEETARRLLSQGKILFGKDEKQIIQIKEYLADYRGDLKGVINLDGRVGANVIESLFGSREVFKNPKPVNLISTIVDFASNEDSVVLDYFAGSGTTGHAVLDLNRADGGRRRFILADMGEHFWNILLPRITKVMTTPEWKGGRPTPDPLFPPAPLGGDLGGDLPQWIERSPRLVQVLTLESYDDSLDALVTNDAATDVFDEARLAYLLPDTVGDTGTSDALLNRERLERPFAYALRTHTPEGEKPRPVDLVETAVLALGLRVRRRLTHDDAGRPYVAVVADDPEGRRTLVLWRTVDAAFDPARDAAVLAELELDPATFERVLVNADAALPGAESIDPVLLAALVQRDPYAVA